MPALPAASSPLPTLTPPPATPRPTQPPITVDPPSAGVAMGTTFVLRVSGVLGGIAVTVGDPAIVDAAVDQVQRTVTLTAKAVGTTTVTVKDDRGVTRDVGVRVAYMAGDVADAAIVRITGDPATQIFVKEQAALAAGRQSRARPNATVISTPDGLSVSAPLGEGYFTATGTTHVRVENLALPRISPSSLLVSDFPETLKSGGLLFSAGLDRDTASRFLYYHYNPPGQPDRRIVLKLRNGSAEPATVQFISGAAGPETNDMEVGHLSVQRFLVRLAQNEGTVVAVPPNSTVDLVNQQLPAHSAVSNLMQLRELDGAPLQLALMAQNAADPPSDTMNSALLSSDEIHARGEYRIPEFFFERTYDTSGPDLTIPIGQIPLPNLREGQALAGDYGVLQQITLRMVNNDRRPARVALYANPRGGRATGTFLIDRVLIQAHALAPFTNFKLREYTVPANGYVSTEIVTMPEGGSSYPLNLVVAPDDGSPSPGSPGSPVY
jgi:hypothetical protein